MTLTTFSLLAGLAFAFGPAEQPFGLEDAAFSVAEGGIAEGTRNLRHQVDREKLRLSGDDRRAWIRLIIEAGAKGTFFNPNLDRVKLAKGVSFGREPDVQVFAAHPNGRPGEADVLVYATSCDFIARLRAAAPAPCADDSRAAFSATDDGVPYAAYGPRGEALSVEDPEVLQAFKALRAKLLAAARRLPEP